MLHHIQAFVISVATEVTQGLIKIFRKNIALLLLEVVEKKNNIQL